MLFLTKAFFNLTKENQKVALMSKIFLKSLRRKKKKEEVSSEN